MMKDHINMTRQLAQQATQGAASTRVGLITSYDPNTYSAKVMLQPENVETGWLPITSAWIGNNWGLFMPPTSGDMVEVQFQEDGMSAGFICGRFYNDSERPLQVNSGEFWLVHKSGSCLKFHNDGTVEIVSNSHLTATVGGNMTATVQGNVEFDAQGTVTHKGGGQGSAGGVVQADCVCAFTGAPHVMISATVKASK